jgi:phosphatidylserine/phosphatidylglycerophosphate/cardiolipin synthase-like enzyme
VDLLQGMFQPLRNLAGPLHRRRPTFAEEPERLPPLPPPWNDERWFPSSFPPRMRNTLQSLIDGEEYMEELHRSLLCATARVTIAAWCLTPLMPLLRGQGESDSILANVLNRISAWAEVYVLLWAGADVLFQPTKTYAGQVRRTLRELAPRVRCELDHSAAVNHDHHQKAVTIDGRLAYVGGIDLTTFQGDRWDTQAHPLRFGNNWHDVQMRVEGEAAADIEENFAQRWREVTREKLQASPQAPLADSWKTPVQVVRSIPKGFYSFAPEGEHGIYRAITTALKKARRFVYLENQYIWAPEVVEALCEAMNKAEQGFRIVLVLPEKAENGRYDNDEHVRTLTEADAGHGMFSAYSLYAGGVGPSSTGYQYVPIYVHAKVSIVDDEWFSVGSANLNRRGFATDAEMNVQSIDPEVARSLRVRLWAEHLGIATERVAEAEVETLVDVEWPAAAKAMERCIGAGAPPVRSRVRTYVPKRNLVSRVLDALQDVTLEH